MFLEILRFQLMVMLPNLQYFFLYNVNKVLLN
nr:MAG TPA: hypothetical protein [Bacteriophage sp.]